MPGPGHMGPAMRMGGRRGGLRGPMIIEKPKNIMATVKRLFLYIGYERYILIDLLAIMLVTTVLGLVSPALQQRAIDTITIKKSGALIDFAKLRVILFAMALTFIALSAVNYMEGLASAYLSQRIVKKMRQDLFGKIERLSIKFFDTHQHGDIMSRMTNDIDNISSTMSQSVSSLFSSVITIIGALIMMLYYSPLLTAVSMVTIPISLLATTQVSKYTRKYFLEQQVLLGKLNGHVEEMVTGYKTVAAFGYEQEVVNEFDSIASQLKNTGIKAQIFGGIMGPLMNIISNLNFLLIVGTGAWMATKTGSGVTVGVIQAFVLYSNSFTRPINEIANLYNSIQTAIAGAERVFEIMDAKTEPDEGKIDIEKIKGEIDFDNIYFSYIEGESVLRGFNLKVKAGQKVALVGKTGAGKTTIVNLLTRFYDIDGGAIRVDKVDIREITKQSLRKSIAIVLQDTVLFGGTIADNIRYGRLEATDEEVVQAAKTANAHAFISRLPDGYDTVLNEAGDNLSQGQRQLLSIARAVLADPQILILDEATSSVDTRTEMNISRAMIALMKERTSLIIAHRLSTIRDADVIVVVDDGKIAEAGSHDKLICAGGKYYELYQNQFVGIST
ncbi:MAG: ABC transporter ATP-binding protein [Bacillota bacterium]|nr:ABC transporter ATP-binding protein [Bacillota bacterium]